MPSNPRKLLFRQFQEDFFHTGAILPSSKAVARACTAFLAQKQGSVRVLEAGPGTGAFTREIVSHLEPGDALDLVEINPVLVSYLYQQFQTEPAFQAREADICLVNADLCRFPFHNSYDYIISSLPFTNFPPDMVEEILRSILEHLKPGGVFSYIKYVFLGRLKHLFSDPATRTEMDKNQQTIARFAQQCQLERRVVWANVPPTWVFYWRKPARE